MSYWVERIRAQLRYAKELCAAGVTSGTDVVQAVEGYLEEQLKTHGAVTNAAAQEAERRLAAHFGEAAKGFSIICVGHAHIDMNWMWRYDETVSITLETFRTVLDLMNEYPDFTFSQSQASVYEITAKYDPEMLEEIRGRIREGRWEVTAATWVEADKNMPSGESAARHLLYTKRFLAELLDIPGEGLDFDFEPDTFGHSVNVPEILTKAGVKYYYHCRGYAGHNLYRWQSPSGSSILVYREPHWYNAAVRPDWAYYVPQFCVQHGLNAMLRVYGVGDHGGGPTRRDLERIIDMNTWPVFPNLRFGTYREFFALAEAIKDKLPVVEGELNFVFTGCYTSQSRIKMANKVAENALGEAELFQAFSHTAADAPAVPARMAEAWQKVLFNQFHDIIPGSGIIDTREHAMGTFQMAMAEAGTAKLKALRQIASAIDTSPLALEEEPRDSVGEGAGVGFGLPAFRISQTSRSGGRQRLFHVFNSAPVDRCEPVEIVLWDWQGDLTKLMVTDGKGEVVPHQILDSGVHRYWDHSYVRILVQLEVPACGYATCLVHEDSREDLPKPLPSDPRLDIPDEFVLENEQIRAEFHPQTGVLRSLVVKATGQELIDQSRAGGRFRLITEDDAKGMTSWRVGRYMEIEDLTRGVRVKKVEYGTAGLRQSISFETEFGRSKLVVVVSLDRGSTRLDYDVECHWHERGRPGEGIPQLNFYLPLGYDCQAYRYDVPCGTVDRPELEHDVPANSWAWAVNGDEAGKSLAILSRTNYGFRGCQSSLSLALVRSSFDPDPDPEYGVHQFKFTLHVVDAAASNQSVIQAAQAYNQPLTALSVKPTGGGSLPLAGSFMRIKSGTAALSAVKLPEDGPAGRVIVRLYETEGTDSRVTLEFQRDVLSAEFVDLTERGLGSEGIELAGRELCFPIAHHSLVSVKVQLKEE